MNLTYIDWLIMLVYFIFVLGIGFALKRYMRTSNDFFLAGRVDSGVGLRAGVYLGQPGSARGDRHGGVGCEVRHRDQPFLLDRRDSGDVFCRASS